MAAAATAAAGRTPTVGHYPSRHPGGTHPDPRRMVAVSATGQSRLKPEMRASRSGQHRGAGSAGVRGQYAIESGAGVAAGSSSGDRRTARPTSGRRGPTSTGAPPPPPPVHATSSRGYSHRYVTGVDYYSEEDAGGCCCLSSLCRHCDFIQVIAFICGLIVVLLMILCLASSNWLTAEKFRQGLWEQCIDDKAPQPLPFDMDPKKGGGCYPVRQVGYIQAAAVLCVLTLLFDIGATVMTGCGLCSKEPRRKYLLYRIALYVMVSALLCILVALVIYPACFAAEIERSNRQLWEFGWAYGVGWGAAIFLFGAILLLLCDKETEEIYYKERAITHHRGNDSKA